MGAGFRWVAVGARLAIALLLDPSGASANPYHSKSSGPSGGGKFPAPQPPMGPALPPHG